MTTLLPALMRHRIVGNAALYTLGGVVQRGAMLLVLPLYTYYLPPSELGLWALLATSIVLLTSVADLGGNNATLRLFYEHLGDPERIRSFVLSGLLFRIASALLAFVLVIGAGMLFWERVVGADIAFVPFVPLLGAAVAAELLVSYGLTLLRVQERAGRYLMLVLGQTVLQLAGSLFFVIVLGQGALGLLSGLLLGTGVTALVASVLFLVENGGATARFRASDVRESLVFGLPLVPHQIAFWLRSSADRFILVQYVPLATVGIYHLGYSAGLLMMLLAKGMSMAFEPYYFRLRKTHGAPDGIIRSVTGLMGAALGGVCLVGVLFADELIGTLLAPEYRAAAGVAPLILVSFLLNGVCNQLNKPLFYRRRTSLISWLTVTPAVATFALCFVLIPVWGMMAAVWLTFANHLVVALLVGNVNRRLSPGQYPLVRLASILGIVIAGAVWVTYAGSGWMPAAAPAAKAAFLTAYAGTAWMLLVREPLRLLRRTANLVDPALTPPPAVAVARKAHARG